MKFAYKLALNVLDNAIDELLETLKEKIDGGMSFFYNSTLISKKIVIASDFKIALFCSLQDDNWYETLSGLIASFRDDLNMLYLQNERTGSDDSKRLEQLLELSLKICASANLDNIDFDESDLVCIFQYAAFTYISLNENTKGALLIRDAIKTVQSQKEESLSTKDNLICSIVKKIVSHHLDIRFFFEEERLDMQVDKRALVFISPLAELADSETFTQQYCHKILSQNQQNTTSLLKSPPNRLK